MQARSKKRKLSLINNLESEIAQQNEEHAQIAASIPANQEACFSLHLPSLSPSPK